MQRNHPLLTAADLIQQHAATIVLERKFCETCGHTLRESTERYQEVLQLEAMVKRLRQFVVQESTHEHRVR
jgi:hypothetical protein